MFKTLLTIWLTVIIICCPILCSQGICGCAEVSFSFEDGLVSQSSCCSECRKRSAQTPSSNSSKEDEEVPDGRPLQHSCDGCQCVCSGAVLETSEVDTCRFLSFLGERAQPSLQATTIPGESELLHRNHASDNLRPLISGRELRIAHMSFLC